uniref:Uncharacterized protein n=1 Tax=Rubinisphaera brasiliensis (strain ATCC 49424 / DSM 5305 / JCM 21570 / IAM 15109 / NBRC 103401 / IFAM 1448) TaxID=756272 RepID=F0SS99_RUBBR|nr:hypothetical protein Plabr_0483 [Rubinisphaera brasiliensis DSM 5305]
MTRAFLPVPPAEQRDVLFMCLRGTFDVCFRRTQPQADAGMAVESERRGILCLRHPPGPDGPPLLREDRLRADNLL